MFCRPLRKNVPKHIERLRPAGRQAVPGFEQIAFGGRHADRRRCGHDGRVDQQRDDLQHRIVAQEQPRLVVAVEPLHEQPRRQRRPAEIGGDGAAHIGDQARNQRIVGRADAARAGEPGFNVGKRGEIGCGHVSILRRGLLRGRPRAPRRGLGFLLGAGFDEAETLDQQRADLGLDLVDARRAAQ